LELSEPCWFKEEFQKVWQKSPVLLASGTFSECITEGIGPGAQQTAGRNSVLKNKLMLAGDEWVA